MLPFFISLSEKMRGQVYVAESQCIKLITEDAKLLKHYQEIRIGKQQSTLIKEEGTKRRKKQEQKFLSEIGKMIC